MIIHQTTSSMFRFILSGDHLRFYQLVNASETAKDLKNAINEIGISYGYIPGQNKILDTESQKACVDRVIHQNAPYNLLTRSFGIRQQAMYIKYYNMIEHDKS